MTKNKIGRIIIEVFSLECVVFVRSVLETMFEADSGLKEAILEKLGCVERIGRRYIKAEV